MLTDYCEENFGGPKAVTDSAYSFSFFFSIKKKPSKVKPDEVPEDVFIMDNYNSE